MTTICIITFFVQTAANVEERLGGAYVYRNTRPSDAGIVPKWDENGYLFFCLCMGNVLQLYDIFLCSMYMLLYFVYFSVCNVVYLSKECHLCVLIYRFIRRIGECKID